MLRYATPARRPRPGYEHSRASYRAENGRRNAAAAEQASALRRRKKQPLRLLWEQGAAESPAAWALVLNDDIAFRPEDLARLSRGMHAHSKQKPSARNGFISFKYTFTDAAKENNWIYRPPYSAFAMTAAALERFGLFDENMWPAFKEDDEFGTRMGRGHDHETQGIENPLDSDVIDQGVSLRQNIS